MATASPVWRPTSRRPCTTWLALARRSPYVRSVSSGSTRARSPGRCCAMVQKPRSMAGERTAACGGKRERVSFRGVTSSEVLSAPNLLEYTYTRTTGPGLGRFFTGLRDRQVMGIRAGDGRVIVPPIEYDSDTAESLGVDAMVDGDDAGVG